MPSSLRDIIFLPNVPGWFHFFNCQNVTLLFLYMCVILQTVLPDTNQECLHIVEEGGVHVVDAVGRILHLPQGLTTVAEADLTATVTESIQTEGEALGMDSSR